MNPKTSRYIAAAIVCALLLVVSNYVRIGNPQKKPEVISEESTSLSTPTAVSQSQNQNTAVSDTEQEQMGSELVEPNPNDVFGVNLVNGEKGLRKVLPTRLANLAWRIFQKYKCDSSQLVVYSKEGKTEKLIVSNCHKFIERANNEHEGILDIEFPVMVSISANSVYELANLRDFGFMYESGTLKAVTDINNNGHLELWLEGSVCECDGAEDENEPCDCTGTRIVEAFEGKLKEFKR